MPAVPFGRDGDPPANPETLRRPAPAAQRREIDTPSMIDHAIFDPAKTDPDAERLNREIIAAQAQAPDPWSMPVAEVRERRRRGSLAYPAMPHSARAETITIPGPAARWRSG